MMPTQPATGTHEELLEISFDQLDDEETKEDLIDFRDDL